MRHPHKIRACTAIILMVTGVALAGATTSAGMGAGGGVRPEAHILDIRSVERAGAQFRCSVHAGGSSSHRRLARRVVGPWCGGYRGLVCADEHRGDRRTILIAMAVPGIRRGSHRLSESGPERVQPYLDGRSEAHSMVDMVRAARTVQSALSSRWIAVGQSQGGHAAMFAVALSTAYAPELDFRGAVATGVPSNIEELAPLGGPGFPRLPLTGTTVFIS